MMDAAKTDDLLVKTSRTFALAIPLLPQPTRTTVSLAYLLFRVADTLEDGAAWERAARTTALADLCDAMRTLDDARARELADRWTKNPPCAHAGYRELLSALPELFDAIRQLPAESRATVIDHATRTAEGMSRLVTDVKSVEELRAYCYVVAGIVGELLTRIFLHDAPALESVQRELEETMVLFGEHLQLVNILKDERDDAGDGRSFMPKGVARAEILALAREDGRAAERYVEALRRGRAPSGFVAFTSLCQSLASASLDRIEKSGAGSKLTRPDVMSIFQRIVARVT
jgi:farnesyl-diphosphate farnesyltransferase